MRAPRQEPRKKARPIPGEEYLVRRPGSDDWHLDITIRGTRLRRSCGTSERAKAAAVAQAAYDALWDEVVNGLRPVQPMTLEQAFIRFYDEVAAGTRYGEQAQKHQMATMLELLPKGIRLDQLDISVINQMVQTLRQREIVPHNAPEALEAAKIRRKFSGATINRYTTTLSAVCTRAARVWNVPVGEWDRQEVRQKESQGREVFLEVEQARALCDAVIPHARPIFLLALATGLRKANAHGVLWENVSLELGRIVMQTKGDKTHTVPLPPPIVAMLAQLEPDPKKRRGPVFRFGAPAIGCTCAACVSPAKRGQPITSTRRAFATAARASGLRDMPAGQLRFHDFRHSVASWVLANGGDLKLLQEQLGHADITTTARYSHLVAGRREAVIHDATAGLLAPAPIAIPHEEKKKA